MTENKSYTADEVLWRSEVEKEGASSVSHTREGLRVEPLYTARDFDHGSDNSVPGALPWTRGAKPAGGPRGWWRATRHRWDDPMAGLEEDLEGGMNAVLLCLEAAGATDPGLSTLLGRVDREDLAVALDGGAELATVERVARELYRREALRLWGIDPLGRFLHGGSAHPETESYELASRLARSAPAHRAMTVSSEGMEGAGADCVQQLGWSIATGVEYLRGLIDAGLSFQEVSGQISYRVAIGRDVFTEVAKLRALRTLWAAVLSAYGLCEPSPVFVHAVGALSTVARRDTRMNILRATNETLAAVLGGADMVTTTAYDELGERGTLGRRVARNTQVILDEESHVGEVSDALGGSYYIEALTDSLARAAWEVFQGVERGGGMTSALRSGAIHAECEKSWMKRREGLARRTEKVTGLSDFADLNTTREFIKPEGEKTLGCHRESEVFEALRDRADEISQRGSRPRVYLATLGERSDFSPRLGFSQDFFASGGFGTTEDQGEDREVVALAARAAASGSSAVCVCASDRDYEIYGKSLVAALKSLGVTRVCWAGRAGGEEASLRALGVEYFIHVGCDAERVLSEMLKGTPR